MRRRLTTAALVAVLFLAACGDSDDPAAPTTTTEAPDASTTTSVTTSATSSSSTSAPVGSTEPPTTTTPPVSSTVLAGEPIEIGPQPGDILAVVGVEHDDVLNVRAGPGADQEIIATMTPTQDDAVSRGKARLLPGSIWFELDTAGVTGWVNSRFVGYLGATDDATAELTAANGGALPEAETMLQLGQEVAALVASTDPPSRITQTVASSVGDLGEIVMDVVGIGDDAVLGFRLHVFAFPPEVADGPFTVKSVERTVLCGRGVSDGLCV